MCIFCTLILKMQPNIQQYYPSFYTFYESHFFAGQTPVPPRSGTWILDLSHDPIWAIWLAEVRKFHQHHDRINDRSWWRHQMETISALLAICAGIHRSPVNSSHKGQWRGALMFSLICTWINCWVKKDEAGDLRRHRVHYDVTVMLSSVDIGATIRWYSSVTQWFPECTILPFSTARGCHIALGNTIPSVTESSTINYINMN